MTNCSALICEQCFIPFFFFLCLCGLCHIFQQDLKGCGWVSLYLHLDGPVVRLLPQVQEIQGLLPGLVIIIIIIMIIAIAWEGAIQDCFYNLLTAANHLQHVHSSGPGAVVCKSRATHQTLIMCNMSCYVLHGTKVISAIRFDRV